MIRIIKLIFFTFIIFFVYFCIDIFCLKYDISNKELVVKKGDSYIKVYDRLGLEYKLTDKIFFKIEKKLSGKSIKLIPGEFELPNKSTKYEIIKQIRNTKVKEIVLAIPEGFTQKQILERIENLKLATKDEMIEALNSIDFPYYHPKDNYDGYLYPNTYIFDANSKAKDVASALLNEFLKHFPSNDYPDKVKFYDNLKLASIVEFETSDTSQKELVAGVFKKRLRINMRLQSDASLKYELDRKVLKSDLLNSDSRYNTYKHLGLPPTPICNPSKETILITLNAKENDFLYFFMEGDNTYYSKTHEEHLNKRRGLK